MTWKHKLSKRLALLKDAWVLIAVLGGCGTDGPTAADAPAIAERRARTRAVGSVTVLSPTNALPVDSAVQFAVTLRDAYGQVLTGRTVTWASSNTAWATVGPTGLVTGVAPGGVIITATSEGKSGSDDVMVVASAVLPPPPPPPPPPPAPVASVVVSPATATAVVGDAVQLAAQTLDSAGQVLTGRTVTWASGNATIASVSAGGLVTGVAAGSTTITATSEGRSGAASFTVTAPPPPPPPAGQSPDLLGNAGFESGWDGFKSGTGQTPSGVTRATDQAFGSLYSARAAWSANATDVGTASFWYGFTSQDRVWGRFYFRLAPNWSITSIQKLCILREAGYGTQFGGLELDDRGLTFSFFIEAGAVGAMIVPRAAISAGEWHSVEFDYRRNGTANPQAQFWFDGALITRSNGPDAAGHGLTWSNNVLDAGQRSSSARMGLMQLLGTRNGGNTGSGTIWIDRVALSTLGRIGP